MYSSLHLIQDIGLLS